MNNNLRTFYYLVLTQMLSIVGSAMTGFAIGIWIFTETGNTTPLLYVSLFTFVPRALFGSIAGVFADRLNRKLLIILGDAGQAIPTLFLMIAFALGTFQVWHLYLATFISGIFGMVQSPALMASITMLVPDSHRDRANSILMIVGPSAQIIAPILGGLLYAVIGVSGVILIDFSSFLVAVGLISMMHIPQPVESEEHQKTKGTIRQEWVAGLRFLISRRGLLFLSLYFMFLNFMTEGVWQLMTPYVLTRVDYNESLLGIILAFSSAGLVTGGLIPTVWRGTQRRIDTILPALGIGAIGLMLFAFAQSPLVMIAIIFVMMLPYKLGNALLASLKQAKIPPDMQGRVFSLTSQLSLFAIPLAMIITAYLVDHVLEPLVQTSAWQIFAPFFGNETGAGMALFIFGSGSIVLIATALTYALPSVRHMERDLPDFVPVVEEPIEVTGDSAVPQAI